MRVLVFNCKFFTLNKQTIILSFSKKGLRQKQNHIRFLSYLKTTNKNRNKTGRIHFSTLTMKSLTKTSFQMFNTRSLFLSYFNLKLYKQMLCFSAWLNLYIISYIMYMYEGAKELLLYYCFHCIKYFFCNFLKFNVI